jgi:hypothetical protein
MQRRAPTRPAVNHYDLPPEVTGSNLPPVHGAEGEVVRRPQLGHREDFDASVLRTLGSVDGNSLLSISAQYFDAQVNGLGWGKLFGVETEAQQPDIVMAPASLVPERVAFAPFVEGYGPVLEACRVRLIGHVDDESAVFVLVKHRTVTRS